MFVCMYNILSCNEFRCNDYKVQRPDIWHIAIVYAFFSISYDIYIHQHIYIHIHVPLQHSTVPLLFLAWRVPPLFTPFIHQFACNCSAAGFLEGCALPRMLVYWLFFVVIACCISFFALYCICVCVVVVSCCMRQLLF